jgi:D-glycero-alpha-D-manno-heptose-7-phosphate kinase
MIFQSCLTIAPLRASFVGGGTDFFDYYQKNGGAVVSTAISKYVYVHVKRHDPLFQERYRISYSEIEHTQSRDTIKNKIVRKSLELLELDEPLQISTSADLPSASGLGSSSSFTVALLLALHSIKGESVGPLQLAEEACTVEIEMLKSPIGKQDQYAAAFGGMNFVEFGSSEKITIQPLIKDSTSFDSFFSNSLLIWTKQTREANDILQNQKNKINENQNNLNKLLELAYLLRDTLVSNPTNLEKIGSIILQSWDIKKQLNNQIQINKADDIINLIKEYSFGHKLLGAGGGGFIYTLLKDPKYKNAIDRAGLSTMNLKISMEGAKVLSLSN